MITKVFKVTVRNVTKEVLFVAANTAEDAIAEVQLHGDEEGTYTSRVTPAGTTPLPTVILETEETDIVGEVEEDDRDK